MNRDGLSCICVPGSSGLNIKCMDDRKDWFRVTVGTVNSIAEMLELDEAQTEAIRDLVLEVAKENYREGNRAGIRWARNNPHPCDCVEGANALAD